MVTPVVEVALPFVGIYIVIVGPSIMRRASKSPYPKITIAKAPKRSSESGRGVMQGLYQQNKKTAPLADL